jgi:hypothetical protein
MKLSAVVATDNFGDPPVKKIADQEVIPGRCELPN